MLDNYGRDITYLRISVTDRCNLRCVYCMPPEGVPLIPHYRILSYERISEIVREAMDLGFFKFRITGGEPLVRKNLPYLVSLLSDLPGNKILTMTTNGTLLAPVAKELAKRGLHSINISLDTLDPLRYRDLTRGGCLDQALAGIEAARKVGLPVKINAVMFDQHSAKDLSEIRRYADFIGATVQTIARYSLGELKQDGGEYDRPPPCAVCDRLRLLADGSLRPCLHGSISVSVSEGEAEKAIRAAVKAKPLCGVTSGESAVSTIGG